MKLSPKASEPSQGYPTALEYSRRMRQALACLAVVGTGVVGNEVFAENPKEEVTSETKRTKTETSEAAKKLALEKVRKEVLKCAADLGVDGFRKRRDAMRRLIAIGSVVEKPPATQKKKRNQRPIKPYRDLVVEEMETLLSHKDPEVKERARQVIVALTPKPKSKTNNVRLGGIVALDPDEW